MRTIALVIGLLALALTAADAQAPKGSIPSKIGSYLKKGAFDGVPDAGKLQGPLDKLQDAATKANDLADKQDSVVKDLNELSESDEQYNPNYELPGAPQLASMCIGSRECEKCFRPAYEKLNETRFRFEKLRKVNRVTKNMLRDSISFGDAMASAAGGLTPLAWNTEKKKIRASEQNFNASYDAKLAELLGTLHETLLAIAACEEKMFGNQAWYDRVGFIYHQFMETAYRRPD